MWKENGPDPGRASRFEPEKLGQNCVGFFEILQGIPHLPV
jgi:hypothetical protein